MELTARTRAKTSCMSCEDDDAASRFMVVDDDDDALLMVVKDDDDDEDARAETPTRFKLLDFIIRIPNIMTANFPILMVVVRCRVAHAC